MNTNTNHQQPTSSIQHPVSSIQPQSPYKGLAPYDVSDKDNFFGRDREKQILLDKIFAYKVTLLFAGTGVGKSSLLRAAVIPILTEEHALDVVYYADWVSPPLDGLKAKIRERLIKNKKITDREVNVRGDLLPFLEICTAYASEPLILMLDQFEELFQYHARSGSLIPFVDQVAQVINAPNLPVSVVFAMREDFLAELNIFKSRIPGLFDNYYRLEQLRDQEARDAIQKPVAKFDFKYQPELLDQLIADLAAREPAHQAGASTPATTDQEQARTVEPPYLQIVCNKLWETEKNNVPKVITLDQYVKLGGTQAIVRTHFEQAMQRFSLREQSLAFEMFRYLVTERGTKMAYRAEDLASAQLLDVDIRELTPILTYLANKEVRVLRADQRQAQTWYELYHDVFAQIIRDWTQQFQKDANRYIYTQLVTAARKWKQESEDTFFLLRGDRLSRAEEWMEAHPETLSEEEQVFIETSSKYAQSDVHLQIKEATKKWLAEKYDSAFLLPGSKLYDAMAWAKSHRESLSSEEQRFLRQSWTKYSRGVWLRRGIVAVIILLALIAAGFGFYANLQRGNAVKERDLAQQAKQEADRRAMLFFAQTISFQALDQFTRREVQRAALLARQSYLFLKQYHGTMLAQLDYTLRQVIEPDILKGHEHWVEYITFSPDMTYLASGSDDKTVRIWDLRTPTAAPRVLTGHAQPVMSVAFSPDGQFLASGSEDKTVWIWEVSTLFNIDLNQPAAPLRFLLGHKDGVMSVAFSPDSKFLASGSNDKTVRVWDLTQYDAAPRLLVGHEAKVYSVAFSPDGQFLASGSLDKTVRVWDLTQPATIPWVLKGQEQVTSVAFSPDGKLLASGRWDGTVDVWDVSNLFNISLADAGLRMFATFTGHQGPVWSVAFSPKGKFLASGGNDATVRVWDVTQSAVTPMVFAKHAQIVTSVAFSPDGTRLASGSYDKTIQIVKFQADPATMICERAERNLTWEEWQQFVSRDIPYERTCFNLPVHPSVLEAAQDFAKANKIDEAKAIFQLVVNLDSGVTLDPATEANKWHAQGLIEEGHNLANKGNIDSAVANFKNALELDPTLHLDPTMEANKWRATGLLEEGQNFAKTGKIDSAIANFKMALKLDPKLTLDPTSEAKIWRANGLVEEGDALARAGNGKTAVAAFVEARKLNPTVEISAQSWNAACWYGSLNGAAAQVLDACEQAVALAPDNAEYRNSRGMARALTGNIAGAIEDFQAYADATGDTLRQQLIAQWIEVLKKGENPFTPEVLEGLK